MIQGVFFDAAGVLYEREQSAGACALDLLRAGGYDAELPADAAACLSALKEDATCGRASADDYWDAFLSLRGVSSAGERTRLRRQILACANRVHELPGARATLAALKGRGIVVGVVTDTMYSVGTKLAWLERIGVADLIDVMACSTVVGVHKPDPAIYRHALQQVGLAPTEAAFAGHDPGELAGAQRVGLTTIAVNNPPGARADFHLAALPDLLTLPVLGMCPNK